MAKITIAVVTSSDLSVWPSCQTIVANLLSSYEKLKNKYDIQYFQISPDGKNALQVAEKVKNYKPNKVVYLDHFPHPVIFFKALHKTYQRSRWPEIYIHVYGDFTLYPKLWAQLEECVRGKETLFICASHKQASLVDGFLKSKNKFTAVVPFPVNTDTFNFDVNKRKEWRKKLGFKDDVLNVLYTGRICLQKNLPLAIKYTFSAANIFKVPCHFWVAGEFDDLPTPLFSFKTGPGAYFDYWNKFLKRHGYENSVTYLGNFNHQELSGLYNASDMFVSLSLYHDEDYGMAAAEALCSGLPSLLTNWGGYGSFGRSPSGAKLVSVHMNPHGLKVSKLDFDKWFFQNSFIFSNEKIKNEISRENRNRYSIDTVSGALGELFLRKTYSFTGFNTTLIKLIWFSKEQPVFKEGPKQGAFYEKIYGHYV